VEAAYKETDPGVFDARDCGFIQSWAKELAHKLLLS